MPFKIPGLSGASDVLLREIEKIASRTMNWVTDWLWVPLRGWLHKLVGFTALSSLGLGQMTRGLINFSERVGHFFDNMPQYVANALISGFAQWFEPVLGLVIDAIDGAWDEDDGA